MSLHLIGTLPQDPDGAPRVLELLAGLRLDTIAVEDDPGVLEFGSNARHAAAETLQAIAARLDDPAQLTFWSQRLEVEKVHFQAFACRSYARECGAQVHFLGDPGAESDSVGDATALAQLDTEALRGMAAFDWRAAYAADYARARRDLEANGCVEFVVPYDQHRIFGSRERALSAQIERLLCDPAIHQLAVVCSVPHLYHSDTGLTVYMQLAHAAPLRYLADGYGQVRDADLIHR